MVKHGACMWRFDHGACPCHCPCNQLHAHALPTLDPATASGWLPLLPFLLFLLLAGCPCYPSHPLPLPSPLHLHWALHHAACPCVPSVHLPLPLAVCPFLPLPPAPSQLPLLPLPPQPCSYPCWRASPPLAPALILHLPLPSCKPLLPFPPLPVVHPCCPAPYPCCWLTASATLTPAALHLPLLKGLPGVWRRELRVAGVLACHGSYGLGCNLLRGIESIR